MVHIHITGASGSGTTTLGRALAAEVGAVHLDADDFFWLPSDPPYRTARPEEDRRALLRQALPDGSWILSGSALNWAQQIEPLFDLIVFLQLDPGIRMDRLRRRETARYGSRIQAGGDMAEASRAFLDWAGRYDHAGPEIRSLAAHEAWLATQNCLVLRLDSARPLSDLVPQVLAQPSLAVKASHIKS